MTQDFAKRRSRTVPVQKGTPGWVWFSTGFFAGIFTAFLVYLWLAVPTDPETADITGIPRAEPNQVIEEMRFDFYDLFPNSEVPIVDDYDTVTTDNAAYLLQAGSFQRQNDADELRAQLILLGLDVFIREIDLNGETWYRVMVGPLETDLALNRAQDTLAEASIESIPLKVTP